MSGAVHANGRVVIRGLETARIMENSFIASLAHAMRAMGEPYDHAYLMGMSGAAFRVQMMQPDWCPSAPHSACGYNCIEPAMEAVPYHLVRVLTKRDDPEAMDALWQRVTASIDAGTPALMTADETGLVTGYVPEDRTLLCRPYVAREDGYVPVGSEGVWTQWPWAFEFIVPSEMEMSRSELARAHWSGRSCWPTRPSFGARRGTRMSPGGLPTASGSPGCGTSAASR